MSTPSEHQHTRPASQCQQPVVTTRWEMLQLRLGQDDNLRLTTDNQPRSADERHTTCNPLQPLRASVLPWFILSSVVRSPKHIGIDERVAELALWVVLLRQRAEIAEARVKGLHLRGGHNENLAPMWARRERRELRFERGQ